MALSKKGALLAIVAPASSCSEKELGAAIEYASSLGFEVVWSNDLLRPQKYLAQSDEFRAKDLKQYLYDESVDVIWCLRGGYGSIRLINEMAKWKKPKNKKLFFGLSDISILHQFFITQWAWSVYHAPVLSRLGSAKASQKEKKQIKKMLFDERCKSLEFKSLKALNEKAKKSKKVQGKIIGGNLCSLMSLQGTKWQLSGRNKILFFEDISERGYAIDRMLNSLKLSGCFKGAKAVVFGDFTGGEESDGTSLTQYALQRFADEIALPVWQGLPSGHAEIQMCIPFFTSANILGGNRANLVVKTK